MFQKVVIPFSEGGLGKKEGASSTIADAWLNLSGVFRAMSFSCFCLYYI
jgi:hypothetical protein